MIKNEEFPIENSGDFIAIGVGSSAVARTYPVVSFLTVLEWLVSTKQKLVFLGKGKADMNYYNKLIKLSPNIAKHSTNLIDQLSYSESLNVLSKAKLFLGVESSLFNAAYGLKVPFIVIYGGGHYGRFEHKVDSSIYVSNKMDCFGCNWENCKYGNLRFETAHCISSIKPEDIITATSLLINNLNTTPKNKPLE